MRRGHISFEEFRLALYTCDPKNPNRTMGFAPGQSLSPKDLFEMYDREEEGAIDRATFIEVLEFLGHKLPLDRVEGIFAAHEDPETEMMPYYLFKKAWLALVDVRNELRNRHEKFNRFLPESVLLKKLEVIINEEEKLEARMLLEAATTLDEERIAAYRRWLIDESVTLSKLVLSEAIDAAGQVYMFGKGPFGRFDGEPMEPDFVEFMDYETVRELWSARVRPNADALEYDLKMLAQAKLQSGEVEKDDTLDDDTSEGNESEDPASGQQATQSIVPRDNAIPPGLSRAKMTLIAAARAFAGRQVSLVPTFLWGKRVRKVSLGPAVAYALTDSGEVFCWGGNKRKWRYFYDTAVLDGDGLAEETVDSIAARQDAALAGSIIGDRPMTTRTEMLKQTMPFQMSQDQEAHDQFYLRQKYQHTFVKPVRQLPSDEEKRRKLHLLGQYFDLLPPDQSPAPSSGNVQTKSIKKKAKRKLTKALQGQEPKGGNADIPEEAETVGDSKTEPSSTSPTKPDHPTYQTLLETIEPDLNVDDLVVALELRGVHLAKQTRMDLIDKLGHCLELELECLGPKFHAHMKEQDKAARRAKHDRQEKKLQGILVKATMLWNELRILQEDIVRIENEEFTKSEREYLEMKKRISHAKQKIKRQAREGFRIDYSGNELLQLNGLTSRGAPQRFFNGDQALLDISVGSRHALAVHQTGKLFAWGVGSFGRLGGVRREQDTAKHPAQVPVDVTDDDIDAWHRDIHSPQRIGALDKLRFREVCCGFGHSLALTTEGDVYVWGSATHGKLGIGCVSSSAKESFTLTPLQLHLPGRSCRVRKVACGPSHSALLTMDGALFVWGSGDGGKLGLGDGRDVGEDCVPRNGGQLGILEIPVRVKALSKENCVDVSCGTAHTAVSTAVVVSGSDGTLSGGRVFVAGSNHALGKFTPVFSPLHIPRVDEAVSGDGESSTQLSLSVPITRVCCGNAHTALVSQDGELLTWGNNAGGCTGHPIVQPLIKAPTRVSCLYQYPRNLCLEKGARAYQSSQNASCLAEFALQNINPSAFGTNVSYAQTQQEMCPFWQVKLAAMSRIERLVVVFKTPASSSATSRTTQRSGSVQGASRPMSSSSVSSTFRSSRSAFGVNGTKYVVLISETPFDDEERGKYSVAKAKGHSIFSSFTLESEEDTVWKWSVPVDTYGKYVRVQIDSSVGMLSLLNVSVVGIRAEEFNGPRVSDVACADGITVAICRPLSSPDMIREHFKRAVRADRNSLWILQQLETFHPFVREELEAQRVTGQEDTRQKCVLCRPKERCVICLLDEATFAVEIQKNLARKRKEREDKHREQLERERQRQEELVRQQKQLLRGGPSTITPNKSRESARRKSVRDAKAKAEADAKAKKATGVQEDESEVEVLKRTLTLEDKCQRLLRLNMRTEEEEEEAEKRLAAELLAIDPLAAAAAQAEKEKKQPGASNQATEGISATNPLKRFSLLRRLAALLSPKQNSSTAYAPMSAVQSKLT